MDTKVLLMAALITILARLASTARIPEPARHKEIS